MAGFSILTLNLRAPLFYTPAAEPDPFGYNPLDGEVLFCFELNLAQYRCFEPGEPYLGPLIFKGKAASQALSGADGEAEVHTPGLAPVEETAHGNVVNRPLDQGPESRGRPKSPIQQRPLGACPEGSHWFQRPRGTYLFAQMRENLTRDQWIAMAMEVQQEGLWRRLQPETRLYLRYLQEDDRVVTQVWRAFTGF
ncbi:MAG: hypothetical protein LBB78_12625 [Spirochaetaceae bacterium]|nr:hypothetical protein [Spirochaetaceae bacterium]